MNSYIFFKHFTMRTRNIKNQILLIALIISLVTTNSYCQQKNKSSIAPTNNQPNIIVILVDDMAQWAMGAYGLEQIETPNMDYLAETGVRFANAMTPVPVCSPARASFFTGKIPSQHGVHDFLAQNDELAYPWLKDETLLSQRLKKLGYTTALLGKWHATTFDKTPQPGFDYWLSYNSDERGWKNQYEKSGKFYFSENGKELIHTGVQAHYLTDAAIRFIDNKKGNTPFFISLNFTEPHAPFAGWPERIVSNYRSVAKEIVQKGGSSSLNAMSNYNLVPENHEEQLAQYLAGITLVDEQIGRIIDALEGRKLDDNTVIVFTSDHGMLVGQYGLYGKVNASMPYNFYEETIRIPMLIKAPNRLITNRQVRNEFVDLIDLHQTILDFAGSKENLEFSPGKSMLSLLKAKRNNDWRNYQIIERGNARMITNGHWKLVRYYYKNSKKKPLDLWYDLSNPMGERQPTEPPRTALSKKLIQLMESYFNKYEDKRWSGRNIWNIPPHNFRAKKELEKGIWD